MISILTVVLCAVSSLAAHNITGVIDFKSRSIDFDRIDISRISSECKDSG